MGDLARAVDSKKLDIELLAKAAFAEDASGGSDAWRGVANTMLNRLEDGRWGKNLSTVLEKSLSSVRTNSKQFKKVNTGDLNPYEKRVFDNIKSEISELINTDNRVDNTMGATHFENVKEFGMPDWAKGATPTVTLGNQVFFKDVQ